MFVSPNALLSTTYIYSRYVSHIQQYGREGQLLINSACAQIIAPSTLSCHKALPE